jgi:hypothetical protein
MTVQEEYDEINTPSKIEDLAKPIDPGIELAQLRKELSEKEEAWAKEREDLLLQLERKNEWIRAKEDELKLVTEKMTNQRVHKLVEINTLARLVEESLALAEFYRSKAKKAKSEVQENTLELQVLQSAFQYARKEIHDLDRTRNKLVGEYISEAEKEAHSKQVENKFLYQALGDAEQELKTLRLETAATSQNLRSDDISMDDNLNTVNSPEQDLADPAKILNSTESLSRKSEHIDEKVSEFPGLQVMLSPRTLKTGLPTALLKGEIANQLFTVPSESDLNDNAGLLPQIDHELDPIGSTPQASPGLNDRMKEQQRESSAEFENESPLYTPSSAGNKSDSPSESNNKMKTPGPFDKCPKDFQKRDSILSSLGQSNTPMNTERGVTGDLWKDSGALLKHIDPELEPEPLPNVLHHQNKESDRVGHIRKLMGNFRRVKKSMAGLGALTALSPSVLAFTEQMSMPSDIDYKIPTKSSISEHDLNSPTEPMVDVDHQKNDVEHQQTSGELSPLKEYFSFPEKESVKEEIVDEISSKEIVKEATGELQSETELEKPAPAASEEALNELSEIQSGTNGKLILTKTNISNLGRRIKFLSGLSLGFFDKSRLADIKNQLDAAKDEIDRMKKTNKKHIENALSMISKNADLSADNEDTIRIIAGAKRSLSDVGFLTELDIISFTVESIGDEVSTMEVY